MLLRKIDQTCGLYNGTKLVVKHFGKHIVKVVVVSGTNVGIKILFHEWHWVHQIQECFLWKFKRKQLHLIVWIAMTINKSQIQSLYRVGLYLPQPVFIYEQFYVAISRATSKKEGLNLLICNKERASSYHN